MRLLATSNLAIGYQSALHKQISLGLEEGELVCLLGPNGAGKSTLIKTLFGVLKPLGGQVEIGQKSLASLSPKAIAKQVAVVLTDRVSEEHLRVRDLVAMGRLPYAGLLGGLGEEDYQKVDEALSLTGVSAFADRLVGDLSDGERQKVMIARALAQDTQLIFLDEPTAHLDLPSKISIMHLLRRLARESGKAMVVSTHDMDIALQTADKLWLMAKEKPFVAGVPEDLVIDGSFGHYFQLGEVVFDVKSGSFVMDVPKKAFVNVQGEGPEAIWLKRALERNGFGVGMSAVSIEANERSFRLSNGAELKTIAEVLANLPSLFE